MFTRKRSFSRKTHKNTPLKIVVLFFLLLVIIGGGYFLARGAPDISTSVKVISSKVNITLPNSNNSLTDYVKGLFMTDQESLPELAVGGEYLGSVAIVSDSHSSFDTFSDVISRIEQEDVDLIIHLGDISAGGELEDLERMKAILDETGVEYEVLPGDHDFNWVPEHDLRNFRGVFGFAANTINRTRSYKGFNLVFYNNSDKTTGLDAAIDWLNDTLPTDATIQGRTILFTSTPIENPYFNDKKDPNGDEILKLLTTRNIKQVFSGDTHIFSRYKLGDTDIVTTTVGASGDYKNPLPQYVLVDFYANGDIDIKTKPAVEIESGD